MKTYDAIVIGAGPGGYPCSIRLAQLKQKVVCIEMDQPGGVCLNWGCIPSKALIRAAHQFERAKDSALMGIRTGSVELDVVQMQTWKDGIVKRLTGGVRSLLKMNGAEYLAGRAKVTGPRSVDVERADGSVETLEATKGIVVATGSRAIEIPAFKLDGERIIGAKEALSLREIPKRLLVIGGGVIGLELGSVYMALGSQLTIVEALPNLLTGVDRECVNVVERRLGKRGATIFKSTRALGWERQSDGSIGVKLEVEGKTQTSVCDVVLVAVGMRPNALGMGLEDVGVTIDARGFVPTDKQGRTNLPTVYAVGDVSGPPLLAHKATKEGEIVAEVIAGHKAEKDWASIPAAVFTDPEIASAGMTAEEAQGRGVETVVGKFPFAALGKAMAIGDTEGFAKVVADKKTKQVLGVHIVGPEASTTIGEAALALEMAAFVEDLAFTVHPHPTLGEALMESAAHAMGAAIHIANR